MEIISRADARAAGATRYFDGKACKRGHIAQRQVASRTCCECLRLRPPEWRSAAYKAWIKSPEGRLAQRKSTLKCKYNLTLEQYSAMLDAQDHKCAICGRRDHDQAGGVLFVDHDHAAGDVRGLLCDHCNRGLGYFKDNPEALRKAALYLETPPERTI